MTVWRKLFCVLGMVVCLTALPGCWDYQRINFRAAVIGIGIDPSPEDAKQILYTIQVPVYETGGGQSKSFSGEKPSNASAMFQNYSVSATSFAEAMAKMQTLTDKSIFLGNLQVVLLNTHLSADQVLAAVSELMRLPTTDKIAYMVATNDDAKDILGHGTEVAAGDKIDRFYSMSVKQHGFTNRVHLWEFWRDSEAIGVSPHLGTVGIVEDRIAVDGVYAFDKTKPVVHLSPMETLGYNLAMGRAEAMTYATPVEGRQLVVHNMQSRTHRWATWNGNRAILHVRIAAVATLAQDPERGEQIVDDRTMTQYEKAVGDSMQKLTLTTIQKFQKLKVDPYGFGRELMYRRPGMEKVIQQHWADMFSNAQADVTVHVSIKAKGTLM